MTFISHDLLGLLDIRMPTELLPEIKSHFFMYRKTIGAVTAPDLVAEGPLRRLWFFKLLLNASECVLVCCCVTKLNSNSVRNSSKKSRRLPERILSNF